MVLEITTAEWQKAKDIQHKLRDAANDAAQHELLVENCANNIILGKLGTAYLPRFHQMVASNTSNNIDIGIPGLNHNFIAIEDKLYVIDNVDKSARLGAGQFGQVFSAQNEDGIECAIKVEPTVKHSINEVNALSAMNYLQATAEIDNHFYTVMNRFPGHSLAKVPHPWKAAVEKLGFNLTNLQKVKTDFGYDGFDDPDFYSAICKRMSNNTTGDVPEFTIIHLEQLKANVRALEKQNIYSDSECLEFVISAGEQMKHAFDNGILHRDIKGDNFVGQINVDKSINVAMVDFGGAINLSDASKATSPFGTPKYMAPEVLCSLPIYSQIKCFPNQPVTEPKPAAYSCASDIFSFAGMCEYDFNMDPNAGFGVLPFAKSIEPKDRPSIENILTCFKAALACLSANSEDKLPIISDFIQEIQSSTMSEALKHTVLSTLVNKELNNIHDKFSLEYTKVAGSPLQSQGFFAKKPSTVAGASMKEIAENAAKPHVLHHRKRDVLKTNGWIGEDNQPKGLLKKLLHCEAELATEKQNTPILK